MKEHKELLKQAIKLANPETIATKAERQQLVNDLQQAIDNDDTPKWWVLALKILAYAIGLILAGYGTTSVAAILLPQLF